MRHEVGTQADRGPRELDLDRLALEELSGQDAAAVEVRADLVVLCDERLTGGLGIHGNTPTQTTSQVDGATDATNHERLA